MYIAYFYKTNGTPIAQVEALVDVNVNIKLNAIGNATFRFASSDFDIRNIVTSGDPKDSAYWLVKITKQYDDGSERTIIEGRLVGIEADYDFKRIIVKTYNHILERRELQADLNIALGQQINVALGTIISTINAVYNTGIVVDSNILDLLTEAKNYDAGQSVLTIVKDMLGSAYDFDLVPSRLLDPVSTDPFYLILKAKAVIGTDYSSEVQFQDDIGDPESRNIATAKATLDFTKLSNAFRVVANNTTYVNLDATDIANRGIRLDASIASNGSGTALASKELQARKVPTVSVEVTPYDVDDQFFTYNVGDLVGVWIYRGDPILDYSGSMKVTEKTLVSGDDERNTIKIAVQADSDDDDPVTQDKRTRERVKNLELKVF